MIYYILFFLLIVIIVTWFIEKKITNPIIIFSGIWFLVLLMASFRLYNMIDYTEKSLGIIFAGLVFFIFGAYICMFAINMKRKSTFEVKEKKHEEEIKTKKVEIILILGILLTALLSVRVVMALKSGVPYTSIRSLYYSYGEGALINNEKIFTIFDWSISVIFSTTTVITIIGIFNNKYSKKLVIEYLIFLILYVFSTSGRMPLLVLTIEALLMFMQNKKKINKKVKKIAIGIISALLIGFILMTSIRTSNVQNKNVNSIYAYFSLPLPYFSKMVDVVDANAYNTYGLATCYGPYLLIQKAVKILIGYKFENAEMLASIITKPQTYWIRAFMDTTDYYNAYATMFYNFYLDFRLIGVIIFSFLYGMFMERIYLKNKYINSFKTTAYYLIFTVGMIQTFAIWQFASPTIFISLFVIKNVCYKRKIKNE